MKYIPHIALSLTLLATPVQAIYAPFALSRGQVQESFQNQSQFLSTQEATTALNRLKQHLSQAYPNHSFDYDHIAFHNDQVHKIGDSQWTYQVDVTLHATARLTTAPENHPLLKGMYQGLESLSPQDSALVLSSVQSYEANLHQAYLQDNDITACYRLVYTTSFDPSQGTSPLPSPQYYYGQRYTMEDSQLPSTYLQGGEKYNTQVHEGQSALLSLLAELKSTQAPTTSTVYDSQKALAYAKLQGTAYPEYNATNRMGNDCANFVSFALMAGGIPADVPGDWFPSPSPGTYGGLNWIRTGFVPEAGGVVPYLEDKHYFFAQSDPILLPQGSILFYKEDSHISLVTYHDGELMLNAYHSNETVEYNNYLHEGDFALFYSPHPNLRGGAI